MAGRVVACDRRIGTGLQRRAWPLGASRDLLAVRSPKEQEGEPVATASIGHRRRRGIEGASGALRGVQRRGGTEVEDQGPRVGVAGESCPGQTDRRRCGRGLESLLRRWRPSARRATPARKLANFPTPRGVILHRSLVRPARAYCKDPRRRRPGNDFPLQTRGRRASACRLLLPSPRQRLSPSTSWRLSRRGGASGPPAATKSLHHHTDESADANQPTVRKSDFSAAFPPRDRARRAPALLGQAGFGRHRDHHDDRQRKFHLGLDERVPPLLVRRGCTAE
jgi:hypothetical protein